MFLRIDILIDERTANQGCREVVQGDGAAVLQDEAIAFAVAPDRDIHVLLRKVEIIIDQRGRGAGDRGNDALLPDQGDRSFVGFLVRLFLKILKYHPASQCTSRCNYRRKNHDHHH